MGYHDKAAVSISSDISESVLIRDIPAGYEPKTYLDIYQLAFELEDVNSRSRDQERKSSNFQTFVTPH